MTCTITYIITITGFPLLKLNSPQAEYNFYSVVFPNLRVSAFVKFIAAGLYKKLN